MYLVLSVFLFFFTIGFTCYWLSGADLWRITVCYFDVYNTWHYWSHRSYLNLAERMEIRFNKMFEKISWLAQSDFVFVWISTFMDNDLSVVRSNRRIDSRVV